MSRPSAVLVTGASRGVGRAVARRLAEDGARIAVHYGHDRSAAETVFDELPGTGHCVLQADLADPDAAGALAGAAAERLGALDVLVNNAGVFELQALTADGDAWRANWERTLAINLLAPALVCHAAVRQMRRGGGGRIINISSRGAFRGEPQAPAYGASKAGLNAMSQSLAQALAAEQIYVFVVAPGFVATDMTAKLLDGPGGEAIRWQSPLGRVATAAEIAETVAFLAGDAPAYLTGAIIDVNGASYLRS